MCSKMWIRSLCLVLFAVVLAGGTAVYAKDTSPREFRIVLVPERNIFEQERKYRVLCDYMCARLGVEMTFEVLKSYNDVMVALEEGEADGGFLGSFLAVHGIVKHGLVPLVRPEWLSGDSHYSSYVFKRKGSPITRDITTWKGRSIALASRHTSAGFFFPLALVRNEGIKDLEEFFSEVQLSGSHDASIWMVANGLADLGAAKNTVFDETMQRKPGLRERVEILHSGGHYPDSTLVLSEKVPPALVERIRSVFLGMSDSADGREVLKRFKANRFIPSPVEDYKDVLEVVKAAGYDIEKVKVAEH
jgi:phosphonate transport system substrate-binding protein